MRNHLHIGDVRAWAKTLPPQSVQTIVTSPPYFGLRSYLDADHPDKAHEMGSEATPAAFVAALVDLFRDLRTALRDDGTCWINLGDSFAGGGGYYPDAPSNQNGSKSSTGAGNGGARTQGGRVPDGLKPKDLIGIPWRVALALQADGWYLRSDCIWHKPNPMPESVTDRPTRSHEHIFLLSKRPTYYYDAAAIAEPGIADKPRGGSLARVGFDSWVAGEAHRGEPWTPSGTRNKRDVWTVASAQFPGSHFATFPPDLIRPCILAGSRPGDLVCDPFMGSGTTAQVCVEEGRDWLGCDIDERARGWLAERLAALPVARLAGC